MKKNIYLTLLISSVLLVGISASAKVPSQQALSRKVDQKVETATNNQQVTAFMKQLAKKNPAQLAEMLLQYKVPYVSNDSVIYIGVKDADEVLVVCQINDSDVGTFYHMVHKKADRWIPEPETTTPPSTQGFATLFERK